MESTDEDYKNFDQIVSGLLKHLAFLQYYPPESVSLRGTVIFTFMVFITLQPALGIHENFQTWDFQFRVASLDSLIFSLGVLVISMDIFLFSDRFQTVVNLTKSKYKLEAIVLNKNVFEEKLNLVRNVTSKGFKNARAFIYVSSFFQLSFLVVSLSEFISYFLQIESTEEKPPRPYYLHSSFSFPSFFPKFVGKLATISIELFSMYYTIIVVSSVHIFQSLSIGNIIGDMELFYLNLDEVDDYFEKVLKSENDNNAITLVKRQMENELRSVTRNIVLHHQNIYRKVQQLNYGSVFRIIYTNCYICLQIVFGISIFLKGELVYKIKYGFMLIGITAFEYIYNETGQRLQDEGERMRMILYGSKWLEKPVWFTKTLQILMMRSNKLTKVGVLNIFTLNRNNVTEVIRGAYSYFNLLNEFKS